MRRCSTSITLALLFAVACSSGDDRAALSTDTALARELADAAVDTTSYIDAADVAMRDIPDSRPDMRPTMRVPERQDPPVPPPAVPPRMSPPPRANDAGTPSIPRGEPVLAACESPARADQRRCLLSHLARSDRGLDRTYQAVISELKRRADATAGREPASVLQLRTAQRAWLVYRDTECRRRNRGQEGPLWAPARARCLGEFSTQREEELAAQLARLRQRG